MKKHFLTLFALLFVCASINAQTDTKERQIVTGKISKAPDKKDETPDGWKKGGEGILNFSITNFNDKWIGGNQDAVAVSGNFGVFANYKKGKISWDNTLRLALGFIKLDSFAFRKADDAIVIESKVGYAFNPKLYGVAFVDFTSQLAIGRNYTVSDAPIISKFMSPGIVRLGAGIDWRPTNNLSLLLAPVAFRGLIVNDQAIADLLLHGNDPIVSGTDTIGGEKFSPQFGLLAKMGYKREITKNIVYSSDLDFFGDYLSGFEKLDLRWNNKLNLKVNKYIGTTLESTLIYNPQMDTNASAEGIQKGAQHRLFLGVGFSYKF